MSYHSYLVSRELASKDRPFSSLIMAAYRKADTLNAAKIKAMWPEIAAELEERYNAPGGLLPDEIKRGDTPVDWRRLA